jgi:hypothetical protein
MKQCNKEKMRSKKNLNSYSAKVDFSLSNDEEIEVTCDDEFVKGLEILMNKANYDLKRSKELLGKGEVYKALCELTIQELNTCQKSYMKVCNYAYKMRIMNDDPDIHYASVIGDAVSITTDQNDVTTSTAIDLEKLAKNKKA